MRNILLTLCLLLSCQAFSYTECNFENVSSIFLGTDDGGNELVYASLTTPTGGYISIHKNKSNNLSAEHLGRIYAALLTAYSAGKEVQVRYPEDNLSCSTLTGGRSDFIGFRIH